jgi:hypothetical protein
MTARTLNATKGWPHLHAVDKTALLSDNVTLDPVPPGSVVHLNSAGQFELGVGDLDVMPLFTFNGSDDPDAVNNGGDPAVDKRPYVGITPGYQANILAIAAVNACELVSTRYNTAESYPPNTLLTAPANNATGGAIEPGTKYVDTICGMVSDGVVNNGYGYDAVAFWPILILPS